MRDAGVMSDVAARSGAVADYRPDIDGLRALAIGAVLLFHFELLGAEGGFVGVDVFFVISGYLMTSLLARANAAPGALLTFYKRRFWRIAPAYLVTLVATLVFGCALLLPVDVERLGWSAVASTFFVSNFFFSAGAGYFDTASIYKPLLHTWSLAVEAQFYLIWPFLMRGVLRMRRSMHLPALLLIFLVSFAACQILSITDPKVAFFSLPARLWQFALGGLVGLAMLAGFDVRARPYAGAMQIAALAVIISTPWLARDGDLWPAPWALPACVGAAVLIFAGGGGISGRLLASRPFVFIGRISYSLYLVHWPVNVFVGYGQFPQTPLWLRLASLIACIPLALALYHFVETPMRRYGRVKTGERSGAAAFACIALLAIGLGYAAHRDPVRFSLRVAPVDAEAPLANFSCAVWRSSNSRDEFCKIGAANAEPTSLLWGDSHGMHFAQGFAARLSATGGAMLIAVKDACPPVAGVWRVSNSLTRREDCHRANADVLAAMVSDARIDTVILAARWALYVETTRFGGEKGSRAFAISDDANTLSAGTSRQVLEKTLNEEVRALALAGKRVVILGQVPEMGFDASRCALMRPLAKPLASPLTSPLAIGDGAGCDIARSRVDARQAEANAMLARVVAAHANARIADPRDILCDAELCRGAFGAKPAYRDDNHITAATAARVVEALFPQIK